MKFRLSKKVATAEVTPLVRSFRKLATIEPTWFCSQLAASQMPRRHPPPPPLL
jgi:hypothetical protein